MEIKNISLFPDNQNEQRSLKPPEQKVIEDFGCERFIFCSDAGLASENNRSLNHTSNRAYIVTQFIKKLSSKYRELALNRNGFRRLSDHKIVIMNKNQLHTLYKVLSLSPIFWIVQVNSSLHLLSVHEYKSVSFPLNLYKILSKEPEPKQLFH